MTYQKIQYILLDVVAYPSNSSIPDADKGGSLLSSSSAWAKVSSRPTWTIQSKALSQKQKQKNQTTNQPNPTQSKYTDAYTKSNQTKSNQAKKRFSTA